MSMKFYFAPLQGITGYLMRNAYEKYFGGIDTYFTPFIPTAERLGKKIVRDILPENNDSLHLVPQLIIKEAEEVGKMASLLAPYGYDEYNLNFGCPAGTVVAKGRGSGALKDPDHLERVLDAVFTEFDGKVSIKTRVGVENTDEWERVLSIYKKYPLTELIIHPRVQKDAYKNKPNLDAFALAAEDMPYPVCYNGDINTVEDFQNIHSRFPKIDRVMIGRGLLRNPFLLEEIRASLEGEERRPVKDMKKIWQFHDELLEGYCEIFSGDRDVLFHMKELWSYLEASFPGREKTMKKIRKSQKLFTYHGAVDELRS